jgi:hypothetical protein
MSTNLPAQPAAPDYAAANREGVYADIETLGTRRAVEQAARLGQGIYADGKVYSPEDFAAQKSFEEDKLKRAQASGNQTEINEATTALGELNKAVDFTGLGDAAYAKQAADLASQTNADVQRQQLALRQELGVANAEQTSKEIQAADPEAYAARQTLTQQIGDALNAPNKEIASDLDVGLTAAQLRQIAGAAPTSDATAQQLQSLGQVAAAKGDATAQQLGSIYDLATRLPENYSDAATAAMNPALQSALADYALGGKLNEAQLRDVTNQVRSGQVARGNYLGDAAAVAEGVQQSNASQQLAQQRLQNLLTIQGQVFGQNSALRDQSQAAATQKIGALSGLTGQQSTLDQSSISQLAGLAQQIFGNQQQAYQTQLGAAGQAVQAANVNANEERAARNETYGQAQQKLANASAMVLGQPITNQFGSLGAAQQGAVGFTPINYQGGTQLNANAGNQAANFAQSSYGQQANMWTTAANIAQQDNAGMMSAISGVAGTALGAMV